MRQIGGVLVGGCYDGHVAGLRNGHFAVDDDAAAVDDVADGGQGSRRSTLWASARV